MASVTAFGYKYRYNVFYRTGWNVLFLQLGFTILLLILVGYALFALYEEIIVNLVGMLQEAIASGTAGSLDSATLVQNLEYTKNKNAIIAGTAILMLAAVAGYLITRLALVPARKALQSQKQFVGNIAHELRTPFSIIKTNTEVALLTNDLDTDTRETLESNVEELNRASNIINNLLSINRLVHPDKVQFTNIDLNEVIKRVVETLKKLASQKHVKVIIEEEVPAISWSNASASEQIIMNVVKNAINYTPSGGTVIISAAPDYRGKIIVKVVDTGIGIPEKDLLHIFEPFYRADAARIRDTHVGSGLGLTIVSELVKLHRGKIKIKSIVKEGTTVEITLPKRKRTRLQELEESEVSIDFSHK